MHLGYTLAVSGSTYLSMHLTALMGYTTSQPWSPDASLPRSVFVFNREAAASFGQSRASSWTCGASLLCP